MKIFGIGWHKTGTTSLARALNHLKFDHWGGGWPTANKHVPHYLTKNYAPIFELIDEHDSFEDLPFGALDFYKVLDKHYPDSKFILTVRNPKTWLRSLTNLCTARGETTDSVLKLSRNISQEHPLGAFSGLVAYHQYVFGDKNIQGNEQHYIDIFRKHNLEVMDYFKGRPDALLVMNLEKGDGWKKLCPFLGVPTITGLKFPHENRSKHR